MRLICIEEPKIPRERDWRETLPLDPCPGQLARAR
jgi:hypothetical protein